MTTTTPTSVPIPKTTFNLWDAGFKVFWTVVVMILAVGGTEIIDAPVPWAVPAGGIINYILVLIRQYTGVTPPVLPPPNTSVHVPA